MTNKTENMDIIRNLLIGKMYTYSYKDQDNQTLKVRDNFDYNADNRPKKLEGTWQKIINSGNITNLHSGTKMNINFNAYYSKLVTALNQDVFKVLSIIGS